MATTNAHRQQQTSPPQPSPTPLPPSATSASAIDGSTTDELSAKALNKRYEGLMTVRTKAVKGKGAWYWTHLEPILVRNTDTGLPKAVKLRCSLCDAVFSASNPSRTASEHLKRGTCPNFNSVTLISTVTPSPSASSPQTHHRKYQISSFNEMMRLFNSMWIDIKDQKIEQKIQRVREDNLKQKKSTLEKKKSTLKLY